MEKYSPNYFHHAWQAKSFVEKELGSQIDDETLSLAVNSQKGRSQNQLHVHISCTRADVQESIKSSLATITDKWSPLAGGLLGHDYLAKRVSEKEFIDKSAFLILAEYPEAAKNMGEFGLAALPIRNADGTLDFVLLADRAVADKSFGHVEEIQDHNCPRVYGQN